MIVLGPGVVEHGLDPTTAIIGCGDMGYLGPSVGPSAAVDPAAHIFVVLGKLISLRRVIAKDRIGQFPPTAIETFGALQEAALSFVDSTEIKELIWRPVAHAIQHTAIDPLRYQADDTDYRIRRFMASDTGTIIGIDPAATVEQRMEALTNYMHMRGLTVEASLNGFRDFVARLFTDNAGRRVNLPTSTDPSFPDSWITPEQVDPSTNGGSRRWQLIW